MAFATTGLTELGPYGVPIAIKLQLFSDGTPLRSVLAQGFIARTCDVAGLLQLSHKETGRFCLMMLGPGQTLWNIDENSLHTMTESVDGDVSLINYGSTMQNRNVRVTEMMAVVDFNTNLLANPDVTTTPTDTLVLAQGIINLLDLEVSI